MFRKRSFQICNDLRKRLVWGVEKGAFAERTERLSNEGVRLCPWSSALEATARERSDIVGTIDALALEWASGRSGRRDIINVRRFLERSAPLWQQMDDSPAAQAAVTQARSAIVDYWSEEIVPAMCRSDEVDMRAFDSDLLASGLPAPSRVALSASFARLHRLPWGGETAQPVTQQQIALIREVAPLATASTAETSGDQNSARLERALGAAFIEWRDTRLAKILAEMPPSPDLIDVAEDSVNGLADGGADFRRALAAAHLQYGDRHATDGRAAVLAMLHAARDRELDPTIAVEAEALERTAGASITSAAPLEATIALDLAPSVSPAIHDLVELVIIGTIADRTRPGFKWRWVDPVAGAPLVRMRLDEAQVSVVSQSDLTLRQSRYLSHYEDVPNPEKDRLSRALDLARLNMSLAESSYHSAVSSHNIYPTQWSLNAANQAYTRYSMAVDWYNLCVSSYNMTPSTISQPVFLPYAFQEGTVAQGWVIRGSADLGEAKTALAVDSVERDFVRVGAKFGDVTEATRRDDALDLNTSTDHLLSLLRTGSERLMDQMAPLLSKLPTTPRASLSEPEQVTVGWLLHPFGGDEKLGRENGVPRWAVGTGKTLTVPSTPISPPDTLVADPPAIFLGDSATAAQVASALAPYSCQIVAGPASGSGALVSGDGLVLTCSHVLVGPTIHLSFAGGPAQGEYDAQVVFVNESADVALLRAVGLRTESWLKIRLDKPCEKGEPIIALGNPAVPGISGPSDTVTAGWVANPEAPAFGSKRLVADIAVASGSSGGPLVSTRTGEIVGVVLLVVAPGVSDIGGTSSSGYFAVAAPAHLLFELLGLRQSAADDHP